MKIMKNKALFLDRDGVINIDFGYVFQKNKFLFIPGIFDLARYAQNKGYLVIIITNQSGIGRGYYDEKDFNNLMFWVKEQFLLHNVKIDGIYFCPHHPVHGVGKYKIDCQNRKPNPGMLIKAQKDFMIDMDLSFFIGDKESDIIAGQNAGIKNLILFSQTKEINNLGFCCNNLYDIIPLL